MLKLVLYETSPGNSPIQKYILKTDNPTRALILERIKTFIEEFPDVHTVSIRPLRNKLWEIRVRDDRSREHRLLYTVAEHSLVILHVFQKKTQKTPKKDLDLARKRLKKMST